LLDFEATVRAQPGPAREWLARLGEIAERGDFERSYVELFAVQREAKRERPPTPFRDGDTLLEALWCPGGPDGQAVLQWFAGTIDVARYDNTRARLHLEEALAYAERSGAQQLAALIRETLAEALTWIGASYTQLSNYQEAFEHLYAALDLYTQLDALPRAGRALNYMGIVYQELANTEQAFREYEQALALAEADDGPDMVGRLLANIGEGYALLHQHERALEYLDRAVAILATIDANALHGWVLMAIGRVHEQRGEIDAARAGYEQALTYVQRGGTYREPAEVLTALGSLHGKRGNYAAATRDLDLALHSHVDREIFKTYLALAEVHERFGNYKLALQHFQAFHRIRSEVYDQTARGNISSLKSEFELEKARQQQEISHLRNVELATAYSRLAEQTKLLEEISIRDGLTGIFNRRFLDERLPAEIARATRSKRPLAAILIDLDHFKVVNDTLAHAVGDQVLRELVQVVNALLREGDLFARHGGEEFCILLPDATVTQAAQVAQKVRRAVEAHDWGAIAEGLKVTISAGVAELGEGDERDHLLSTADVKLYVAKRDGRNQVRR